VSVETQKPSTSTITGFSNRVPGKPGVPTGGPQRPWRWVVEIGPFLEPWCLLLCLELELTTPWRLGKVLLHQRYPSQPEGENHSSA
jgi:hypothetical protein